MINGEDGGSHEPGQPKDGADDDNQSQNEKVQMVTSAFLQAMLFPVHNHSCNLLIHEDKDSGQNCQDRR